jgi:hypothetical protein
MGSLHGSHNPFPAASRFLSTQTLYTKPLKVVRKLSVALGYYRRLRRIPLYCAAADRVVAASEAVASGNDRSGSI